MANEQSVINRLNTLLTEYVEAWDVHDTVKAADGDTDAARLKVQDVEDEVARENLVGRLGIELVRAISSIGQRCNPDIRSVVDRYIQCVGRLEGEIYFPVNVPATADGTKALAQTHGNVLYFTIGRALKHFHALHEPYRRHSPSDLDPIRRLLLIAEIGPSSFYVHGTDSTGYELLTEVEIRELIKERERKEEEREAKRTARDERAERRLQRQQQEQEKQHAEETAAKFEEAADDVTPEPAEEDQDEVLGLPPKRQGPPSRDESN